MGIAYAKTSLTFAQAFARGILCNWLVCMAGACCRESFKHAWPTLSAVADGVLVAQIIPGEISSV